MYIRPASKSACVQRIQVRDTHVTTGNGSYLLCGGEIECFAEGRRGVGEGEQHGRSTVCQRRAVNVRRCSNKQTSVIPLPKLKSKFRTNGVVHAVIVVITSSRVM